MRYVIAKEREKIPLGRVAENEVEMVRFYVKGWDDMYGSGGTFLLVHKRPCDTQPYVCATSQTEAGYVDWIIHDEDCAVAGVGEAQLSYLVGGAVAKSVIYVTIVERSLDQTGELPEPYESRIQELMEAVAEAEEIAETATSYSVHPPLISNSTGNWMLWNGEEYEDSGHSSVYGDETVRSSTVEYIWHGTQAEFDLIDPKDEHTLYFVAEASQ